MAGIRTQPPEDWKRDFFEWIRRQGGHVGLDDAYYAGRAASLWQPDDLADKLAELAADPHGRHCTIPRCPHCGGALVGGGDG